VNVTPEHILLGLLKENEGVAAKVLKALEINQDEMRRDVLKELGRDFN